jgi:hypothetical protein
MMNGTPQNGGPELPATAGQSLTTERKTDMARNGPRRRGSGQ